MGCGVAFLPKDSREAKRRNRGQGRTPTIAKKSIVDGADHRDLDVSDEGNRLNMRFKEVLCAANGCSSDGQAVNRDNRRSSLLTTGVLTWVHEQRFTTLLRSPLGSTPWDPW